MSADAKAEILGRIGKALRDVPREERPDDVAVARAYLTADPATPDDRIHRFAERVAEYRATVHRVAPEDLPEAIRAACERRNARNLVIPADIPPEWLPPEVNGLRDEPLTNDQLNASDGVLTGCALGIAQTGTIVLDGGPLQGRRALTLLPDYHLCVVRADQVVGLVPEAVAKLHNSARTPGRPITWISGPSATSDIELNRVEGVHGPRTLEVLIVG
ncbi:LutC/YkgG family protein [Tundrisphaera sp. TA3]|uniref:LutC/YkgG family protein n=1 Tax=Tundrisphaera sp. TA3 TaxID=3435775 RepID=UPI003EBA9ACD